MNNIAFDDLPPVLDACCGSRAFWFDKQDNRALFIDKRFETVQRMHNDYPRAPVVVAPDMVLDFTKLPFQDETFSMVVFDPPHLTSAGNGNIKAFYGSLNEGWRDTLRDGFSECFRVLRENGALIFKWNETQIKVKEVLALTNEKPLFGHKSGKLSKTHWISFLKG